MDLMCISTAKIGLMVIAYYTSFTIGGTLYKIPELIGRKKAVIISSAVGLIAQTAIVMSNSILIRTLSFALMGLC